MQFEFVGEDIENQQRIGCLIFHLFGGFAIDGGDDDRVGNEGVHKLGEGVLQVGEGEFSQDAGEGNGVGNLPSLVFVLVFRRIMNGV